MAKTLGGRWSVVRSLGEGGQGWTYVVTDNAQEHTGELVLKRLKNVKRRDRFETEIEAVKSLDHPGTSKILWASTGEGPCYVTPYYSGGSLEDAARDRFKADPVTTLRVFAQICDAVSYVHSKGIVHRDLKPSNIVFAQPDQPVVIDFGLCFSGEGAERFTQTAEQVGSRFYMAPEFEGGRADRVSPLADSYALGKLLYFMLTERNLPREQFNERDYDLVRLTGNYQLGYVTRDIFPISIVENPEERKKAEQLSWVSVHVADLIREHYYPGKVGSKCRFCGEGAYREEPRVGIRARRRTVDGELMFDAISCPNCGHYVMFATDEPIR